MILEAHAAARSRGVTTAFAVRGFGYYEPRYFNDVDHAFTCSRYLTDVYREKVGLISTPIEPPIDWSTVVAPTDARAFVTFVHPAPHKGPAALRAARGHARLAAARHSRAGRAVGPERRLAERHPGHRLQQVSADHGGAPRATPADYFALTRILLVPSVWQEPFGRVAAEAMINGIPPLVGNRGALPHVFGGDFAVGGGGRVLPIPEWMTHQTTRLPPSRRSSPGTRPSARSGTIPRFTRRCQRRRVNLPKRATAKIDRANSMWITSPH